VRGSGNNYLQFAWWTSVGDGRNSIRWRPLGLYLTIDQEVEFSTSTASDGNLYKMEARAPTAPAIIRAPPAVGNPTGDVEKRIHQPREVVSDTYRRYKLQAVIQQSYSTSDKKLFYYHNDTMPYPDTDLTGNNVSLWRKRG